MTFDPHIVPVGFGAKMTSYRRRCDVASTSIRRHFLRHVPAGVGSRVYRPHSHCKNVT